MNSTRGIIMFNRGPNMVVRALVTLYSLRKYYDGNITFYVEEPYPKELDEALKYFKCDIVYNEKRHDLKTLVRKNSLFENPPYDYTLWLDIDTVIVGKIDKMFDYLIDNNVDLCIPSFCGWLSTGNQISKRIKKFEGIAEEKYLIEALKEHPAINTGVLSFKKSDKWSEFVRYWTDLADKGSKAGIFIPDEVAAQILIPSMSEWGLKYFIAPSDYNVSIIHDNGKSKEPKIVHAHGDKHCLNMPSCDIWKNTFKEMCDNNIANINSYLKYADKRLMEYLKNRKEFLTNYDVTIVTAIDEYYLPILQETFPNWRKYKDIDNYPIIVFVYGIDIENDPRLEFLRLPNVTMIEWDENCIDKVDSHRELILSAFVFGAAEHVKTDYWIKLDADSYAINNSPLYKEDFKRYSIFSHKWGYSRPCHIESLDKWASTHWHKKINDGKPMISQGKIEGNRFYHNQKRFISYICFQRTRFTRYCVKMLSNKRLPCPSQDTYAYYLIQKLKPEEMGIGNFKRDHGFIQGKGKLGAEHIKKCIEDVENNLVSNEPESEVQFIDPPKFPDTVSLVDKIVYSIGISSKDYTIEIKEKQ